MKKALAIVIVFTFLIFAFSGCRIVSINFGDFSEFNYDSPEKYLIGDAEITDTVEKIEIEWIGGNIDVSYHDKDTVSFSEVSKTDLNENTRVHYRLDGTTLKIKFCKSGILNTEDTAKDLTVCIPESLILKELDIDTISADINTEDISADNMNLCTVSGAVSLTGCKIKEDVILDTISGSIDADIVEIVKTVECSSVSGKIDIRAQQTECFSADSTSGDVFLTAKTAPKNLKIDTVSGDANIQLPETSDFTLETDTISGNFTSDIPCTNRDGEYIFGNGSSEYEIDTISGDIFIKACSIS